MPRYPRQRQVELFCKYNHRKTYTVDYGKISEDISDLECKIKDGVGRLRDLEHLPGIEGFRLKPMTGVEAKAIHKAFGMS